MISSVGFGLERLLTTRLSEPGACLDECSNNSTKVLSSSVGSGGQYFTPSPSPTGSPLPHSPNPPDLQSLNQLNNSAPSLDSMINFDSEFFQGDQIDLDGLQLLPEQEAAILAAVGGAQGFTS